MQKSEYDAYLKYASQKNDLCKINNRNESFHMAINSLNNSEMMEVRNSEGRTFKEKVVDKIKNKKFCFFNYLLIERSTTI